MPPTSQDTLDETLPDTLHMTTIYTMILLTSLAIVTVSIHYYAAMTGALFLSFAMMQVRCKCVKFDHGYAGTCTLLRQPVPFAP